MRKHLLACLLPVVVLASGPPPAGGAERHWAYVKPVRPAPPAVKDTAWPGNAVDAFVLRRLEKVGLRPGPAADRARLIRRLHLDLTGIPPSIEAVDAFVADPRADALERVADALLASPAYGERWARQWLDLARHADSNGFQRDGHRQVWAYRSWVIDAMNADMPFDRFSIQQLAGDLLPDVTLDQKIATGFHRGTTVNVEAGVDQEQNRVNAIIDRVNTTGTVWLGTSIECAQCHAHKYDPFSQEEYYRLFALFNNTAVETEGHGGARRDFVGPRVELPEPAPRRALRERITLEKTAVAARIATLEKEKDREAELERVRQEMKRVTERLEQVHPLTALVMKEVDAPRETRVFRRGNFLTPGERVEPGVPASLHEFPADAPRNRLGLARWLLSPDSPLVGRVTVNRWWAGIFGHGLVESLEDLGTQSTPPTHPELLDWLATEFVGGGWSMKRVHRTLVTSATYRQASRVSSRLLELDPGNRLYARGPRFRLDAEGIRDNALAIAGRLCRTLGGPPVRPPQPNGVWSVIGMVDNTYRASRGDDRYRRGIYVVWRRSSPYPSFVNFDAPDRASCCVQRPRTNTPLQALTLLNDEVHVEIAALLAARMIRDAPGDSSVDRATFGFRLCVARQPTPREIHMLTAMYERELERLRADNGRARALLKGREIPRAVAKAEMAAWFYVATVLLNLDETITKG